MFDIRLIRSDPDRVKQAMKTRNKNMDAAVDEDVYKRQGYIKRQKAQIEEMRRLEGKKLPPDLDYRTITGLRLEAQEKLNKVGPRSVGQASRISGVSPADVSVLLIWLAGKGENHGNHS